jgi:hypothetical protein
MNSSGGNMLLLQARGGNSSMMVGSNAAETVKPADKTKLIFNRYRDQYFLADAIRSSAMP